MGLQGGKAGVGVGTLVFDGYEGCIDDVVGM